jgi:phosphomannomutase
MATSVAAGKLATAAAAYPPLNQRPVKGTVLLFDVDETLTKSRQVCLRSLLPKSQP